jgi:chemotaxis protein methyltransferase CheR
MALTQGDFQSVQQILASRQISEDEFRHVSEMIYRLCRINLHDGKKALVQARLNKRLRKLGFDSYTDYLQYVEEDGTGRELTLLINTLTTNLTYFFREPDHFDFLKNDICERWKKEDVKRVRLWSAGCSSGEE